MPCGTIYIQCCAIGGFPRLFPNRDRPNLLYNDVIRVPLRGTAHGCRACALACLGCLNVLVFSGEWLFLHVTGMALHNSKCHNNKLCTWCMVVILVVLVT